jgi:diguanylate cyclase (GGDEF)-like protein
MVRGVLVESLEAAGLTVDSTGDGEDALRLNTCNSFDLIITDMRLPGLDGLTLIKRLKSIKSDTDVMVITGYGTIENAVECMKAGAIEYLIKPFTVDQIQFSVKRALEHRELRKRAQEREFYKELSYIDALTGVRNRRFFDEAIESEVMKAGRLGTTFVLMMLDIDDFKFYNDLYGHQTGDEALVKMARLFTSACRGYDIVTRYGGEEFAILFPGADLKNAHELAARILNEVNDSRFEGEEKLPKRKLTVSIGISVYPDHATTACELIKCADKALFAAKRSGKNRIKIGC